MTASKISAMSGTGSRVGPGNRVIATTLLESLGVRGQTAAHARASQRLARADIEPASATKWLAPSALSDMVGAPEIDPSHVRAVGHRLVAPDAIGLALYGLGLATPEKAYRRIQGLLPRCCPDSTWQVDKIVDGSAGLSFHDVTHEAASEESPTAETDGVDGRSVRRGRDQSALCALRIGMLEAVPCLYGLLPARVVETECLANGATACRYEVSWGRTSRVGLRNGSGAGALVGAALLAGGSLVGALALPAVVLGSLLVASTIFGAIAGRCFDLHRQLEAVAGARRGQLALFDQVDDALASKLDALARADAKLDQDDTRFRPDRARSDGGGESVETMSNRATLVSAAASIHENVGDVECWFEAQSGPPSGSRGAAIDGVRDQLREIKLSATRLIEALSPDGEHPRQVVDLTKLLTRAIASARPSLADPVTIEFDHKKGPVPIECEPAQIEQVVIQLLRNAANASGGLSDAPVVHVSLAAVAGGVEFAIEDRGVGIDPCEIDEVFDPFFGDRRAGIDESFGLPICLRIVERHGGALRIEVEDRPGTRVSVFLPDAHAPEA